MVEQQIAFLRAWLIVTVGDRLALPRPVAREGQALSEWGIAVVSLIGVGIATFALFRTGMNTVIQNIVARLISGS